MMEQCTPWCLLKRAENVCLHKNQHMNVCIRFIHNCQQLVSTKCPQSASEEANQGTSIKWNTIQQQKEKSCEAMKRQGGTLNTYC